ncbi:hypothetical protein GCM10011591_10480 [Nocardia camponoti]|uniref:Uncharacterized protein n=1 Tax=Nocardia camponoti TaxID=1616106 RepID=A0A917QAP4_9NOCA|nr:hypothetical protein GCM10011591_10480 [Nocardia camponoti]
MGGETRGDSPFGGGVADNNVPNGAVIGGLGWSYASDAPERSDVANTDSTLSAPSGPHSDEQRGATSFPNAPAGSSRASAEDSNVGERQEQRGDSLFGGFTRRDQLTAERIPASAAPPESAPPRLSVPSTNNAHKETQPVHPGFDDPTMPASRAITDSIGSFPIPPTDVDEAGMTVTGTYRAFDLERAAHVDKLQAMLNELKRSTGIESRSNSDVFGPPTP